MLVPPFDDIVGGATSSVAMRAKQFTTEVNLSFNGANGGGVFKIYLTTDLCTNGAFDKLQEGLVVTGTCDGPFIHFSVQEVGSDSKSEPFATLRISEWLTIVVHSPNGVDFDVWVSEIHERFTLARPMTQIHFGISAENGKEFTGVYLHSAVFAPDEDLESRLYALQNPRVQEPAPSAIDAKTLQDWSSKWRNWTYWPDPIIPANYRVPGYEEFHNFDVPTIYQLEEQPGKYFMSFIGFNGKGYNSFVVDSTDLIHWEHGRHAMGFGENGTFDHGGRVVGAYIYNSWDVKAPRTLRKKDGKYWTLYGCYPRQGGYELRPGAQGLASSEDGQVWKRAWPEAILDVYQRECKPWEKNCIYMPWLVEHDGLWYDVYNAAQGGQEQSGIATSTNMINWTRYDKNPVIVNHPGKYDSRQASDPKVYWDTDHWVLFYFGGGHGGVVIMVAFSTDLKTWTQDPEPLYKKGGNPTGLDSSGAHKTALVWNEKEQAFHLYYCALGNKGRVLAMVTSKPVKGYQ
jgi:hypothetical protein